MDDFAPDAVLIDLHLGTTRPDGITLCLAAKEHDRSVVVACCSAGARTDHAWRAWSSGVDVFVDKEWLLAHPAGFVEVMAAPGIVFYTVRPFNEGQLNVSPRKEEISSLWTRGLTVPAISSTLSLTPRIVDAHLRQFSRLTGPVRGPLHSAPHELHRANRRCVVCLGLDPVAVLAHSSCVELAGWQSQWARSADSALSTSFADGLLGFLVDASSIDAHELNKLCRGTDLPVAVLGARPESALPARVERLSEPLEVAALRRAFQQPATSGCVAHVEALDLDPRDRSALVQARKLLARGRPDDLLRARQLVNEVRTPARQLTDRLRDDELARDLFEKAHRNLVGSLTMLVALLNREMTADERAVVLDLVDRALHWDEVSHVHS